MDRRVRRAAGRSWWSPPRSPRACSAGSPEADSKCAGRRRLHDQPAAPGRAACGGPCGPATAAWRPSRRASAGVLASHQGAGVSPHGHGAGHPQRHPLVRGRRARSRNAASVVLVREHERDLDGRDRAVAAPEPPGELDVADPRVRRRTPPSAPRSARRRSRRRSAAAGGRCRGGPRCRPVASRWRAPASEPARASAASASWPSERGLQLSDELAPAAARSRGRVRARVRHPASGSRSACSGRAAAEGDHAERQQEPPGRATTRPAAPSRGGRGLVASTRGRRRQPGRTAPEIGIRPRGRCARRWRGWPRARSARCRCTCRRGSQGCSRTPGRPGCRALWRPGCPSPSAPTTSAAARRRPRPGHHGEARSSRRRSGPAAP